MDTGKASNTSAAQQHLPTEAVPTDPQRGAADVEVEIAHHSKVSKYPYGDFLKLRRIQSYNGKMRLEWMCTLCETYNFVGRVSCRQCNAHQTRSFKWSFPPTRHVATFPANWLCESCGHCNEKTQRSEGDATSEQSLKTSREFFFCAKCQVPFGGVRNWYCPSCDRLNTRAASQCTSCWEERPSSWVCKHCECATNSIFTVACRDCKKERPKKKSAYVVPCVCCNTPNDVRWEVCESCLAPLPAMKDFMNIKTEHVVHQPSVTEEEAQSTPPQQQQQISPYKKRYERSESITSETGGAWWCANCNITHRRNVTFCDVCLEPRTAAREGNQREKPSSGEEQEAVTPTLSSGSWTCPFCRQVKWRQDD
ncbi:hypothetical protein AGDE_14905 [Angomonas deanei]|uniref:RanBP2-type domain-containing protein n=1 Tax=Angomonas deanei TaxID=59799 RepID=A0A7G2C3S7_9TRYP|nr:hypothetical protein AGDE_14905 [Angomonas deanei]CAD2214239.1 hypothetical protein, conserved [Angomonas deanei]|eukprot:EPY20014.1 hypothetical protein AGDE_14905 [Angomonas deanei]